MGQLIKNTNPKIGVGVVFVTTKSQYPECMTGLLFFLSLCPKMSVHLHIINKKIKNQYCWWNVQAIWSQHCSERVKFNGTFKLITNINMHRTVCNMYKQVQVPCYIGVACLPRSPTQFFDKEKGLDMWIGDWQTIWSINPWVSMGKD